MAWYQKYNFWKQKFIIISWRCWNLSLRRTNLNLALSFWLPVLAPYSLTPSLAEWILLQFLPFPQQHSSTYDHLYSGKQILLLGNWKTKSLWLIWSLLVTAIAVVPPSRQTHAQCICPQLDRSFRKVGWGRFLAEIKGLGTQQRVFINHCISRACFRIILLEHIQESDIREKKTAAILGHANARVKVLHWIYIQVQRQSFPEPGAIPENDTLHWEHLSFAKFRTLNKSHPHNKIVRYMKCKLLRTLSPALPHHPAWEGSPTSGPLRNKI